MDPDGFCFTSLMEIASILPKALTSLKLFGREVEKAGPAPIKKLCFTLWLASNQDRTRLIKLSNIYLQQLWLSWRSGCFWYQRSADRIHLSAKFDNEIFLFFNSLKEAGTCPLKTFNVSGLNLMYLDKLARSSKELHDHRLSSKD